jgi:hypothetical protein
VSRRFYEDFETGRRGFTDGDLPDGPLVEEISASEWWERTGICVCGKAAMDGVKCRYGASHKTLDDEALS